MDRPMKRPIIGAVAAIILSGLFGTAVMGVIAVQPSDAALRCGADVPGNHVAAEFDLSAASTLGSRLPAAALGPELRNERPAHVVVFGGPYTWFRDGQVYQHVVCVVQADDIYLYPSVNLTGSAFQ